jgi:hypothetical protein
MSPVPQGTAEFTAGTLLNRVQCIPRTDVPYALTCLGCFSSKPPQNRHPERSASQIYRVTQRLMARSRRTPKVLIFPMLFGPFRPPKPENRIFRRHALDGHGYIFSCTVIIFHPQVCARSLNSEIDRANEVELLFAPPAFELFFPSDGCAHVFVTLKVEQALAAIGRSETFQPTLLVLHDAHIQVAGDANVKRACMAAENVDVAAGNSKMLAVLVLGPRERPWRVPPGAGFGG